MANIFKKILKPKKEVQLTEALKSFIGKEKILDQESAETGEGIYDYSSLIYNQIGYGTLQNFYNNQINLTYLNEKDRISFYRSMAQTPEIADVIEDAINESLEPDDDGTSST